MNRKKKKSASQYIFFLNMDNLHFIPNNILTIFLKKKVNKI